MYFLFLIYIIETIQQSNLYGFLRGFVESTRHQWLVVSATILDPSGKAPA